MNTLSDKIFNSTFNTLSPLSQFEIRDLLSIDAPMFGNLHISITNIGLYLTIGAILLIIISLLGTNYNKLVSNNWSISLESLYATIHGIVINQINPKAGQIYFPFIYTLFVFILINNLIGMVPYSFASTSHFVLTFSLSFTIVLGATILGFQKHGLKFFSLLVPAGCPLPLLPLLVLIETISYLARAFSLGIRLFANICAGHTLLKILSTFLYQLFTSSILVAIITLIPFALFLCIIGLEIAVSFIQAYVFSLLVCSYIKDVIDLH